MKPTTTDSYIQNIREHLTQIDHTGLYSHYYGMDIKLNKSYKCPFHKENTASFKITKKDNKFFYKCFGCGKGGDIVQFVMDMTGNSFYDSIKDIGIEIGDIKEERNRVNNRKYMPFAFKTEVVMKEEEIEIKTIIPEFKREYSKEFVKWMNDFAIEEFVIQVENIRECKFYRILTYGDEECITITGITVRQPESLCIYIPYKRFVGQYPACKVYTPFEKPKMIGTSGKDDIFGLNILRNEIVSRIGMTKLHDTELHTHFNIVFIGGHKDTLIGNSIAQNCVFLCMNSENVLPTEMDLLEIVSLVRFMIPTSTFEFFYMMDNDEAGRKAAEHYRVIETLPIDLNLSSEPFVELTLKSSHKDLGEYINQRVTKHFAKELHFEITNEKRLSITSVQEREELPF